MIKKAQGALEFLMTYGWAFLVILIMIGALAYFGVLSPTKFLPDRCSFGSEISCKDYWLNETNVSLRLVNNAGTSVNVTSWEIKNADGFACNVMPSSSFIWQAGETIDITGGDCAGGGVYQGDKFKFDVSLTWYDVKSSAAYAHTTQGEIFRQVE